MTLEDVIDAREALVLVKFNVTYRNSFSMEVIAVTMPVPDDYSVQTTEIKPVSEC